MHWPDLVADDADLCWFMILSIQQRSTLYDMTVYRELLMMLNFEEEKLS